MINPHKICEKDGTVADVSNRKLISRCYLWNTNICLPFYPSTLYNSKIFNFYPIHLQRYHPEHIAPSSCYQISYAIIQNSICQKSIISFDNYGNMQKIYINLLRHDEFESLSEMILVVLLLKKYIFFSK